MVLAVHERITSWAPEPERVTVCGLPLALSAMLKEALRVPAAVGVNITAITQLAPAARVLPHVLVSPKSLALVPVKPTLVMVKVEPPVLVRVTLCDELVTAMGSLPKAKLEVERLAVAALTPVPVRVAVCGLVAALSVTLTEAVRVPEAEGVKVTLIEQLAPVARELPQVLV